MVVGNKSLMVLPHLCTVVGHKYLMSCNTFEFLFGFWDMQFGLSFGFWVVFRFCFGIAMASSFGSGA